MNITSCLVPSTQLNGPLSREPQIGWNVTGHNVRSMKLRGFSLSPNVAIKCADSFSSQSNLFVQGKMSRNSFSSSEQIDLPRANIYDVTTLGNGGMGGKGRSLPRLVIIIVGPTTERPRRKRTVVVAARALPSDRGVNASLGMLQIVWLYWMRGSSC